MFAGAGAAATRKNIKSIKSRSKATGGTGLGLAIVKHIAMLHDAAITLDSDLGRGTKITVTF